MTTLNRITWDQLDSSQQTNQTFALYDHQKEMFNFIRDNPRTNIVASRCMGISTVLHVLSLFTITHDDTDVIFIDGTYERSRTSFQHVINIARDFLINTPDDVIKINSKKLSIGVGSRTITFVSPQCNRRLDQYIRGRTRVRIVGESGCLDGMANENVSELLRCSEAMSSGSSTFINVAPHKLRSHKIKRFPWHMFHPPGYKDQIIEQYGLAFWNAEFEV